MGTLDPDQTALVEASIVHWQPLLSAVAKSSQVPRQILRAILIVESHGQPFAHSDDIGGFGLMQVTKEIEAASALPERGDIFDPETNVSLAAEVLAAAYQRWGSWDMAIMYWHDVRRPGGPQFTHGYSWESASFQYLIRVQAHLQSTGFEPAATDFRAQALLHGLTAVGMPYLAGGSDWEHGGFDCSGLVQWLYRFVGRMLPPGADAQWDATERIAEDVARPGDLVFFANTWAYGISHVGVYMGDGMMLHSPTEGKVVEIIPIHGSYWGAHLAGFGRVP